MLIRLSLLGFEPSTKKSKTRVVQKNAAPLRRARPHHRAFRDWLELNRSRFTRPVELHDNPDGWATFSFVGIHRALSGGLTESGLCVSATYQGDCWDFLFDEDAYPRKVPGGYECSECLPAHKKLFASRAALWHDHLFERLLTWVNEELACATWLVLEATGDGSSWAVLAETKPDMCARNSEDRSVTIAIPLQ
jgi:hypothetical protein